MIRTTLRGGALRRMLGAATFALATAGAAQAAVITFDGNTGQVFNQDAIQEAGYTATFLNAGAPLPQGTVLIGRFINGSDPASCGAGNICPTNDPTTYLDLFNAGFVDITANTGAAFSFSGLDASFIAMAGTEYPATPAAVQVFGFRADGTFTSIQFNLSNNTDFQHFDVLNANLGDGAAFAQESFVEIAIASLRCDAGGNCTGLDNGNGQIGLDNIALSDVPPPSNVPEPATASLLGLGLLGLSARKRKRA